MIRKLRRSFLFAFRSNYGVILYRLRYSDLLVENHEIFIPHLYLLPPTRGDPVGISWRCLILIKLEWLGYRVVEKLWQYVKPFSSNTGTSQTDRHGDGIAIWISRVNVKTETGRSSENSISRSLWTAEGLLHVLNVVLVVGCKNTTTVICNAS